MNFIINAYALQDIGTRDNQEDCFFPPFIDPCHFDETKREWSFYDGTPHTDDRLFIVCDGMGGHDRGEIASQIVTKTMSESLMKSSVIEGRFSDALLNNAVNDAMQALYSQDDPKELKKMGTTMTVLKFHSEGATVGHIGDSRVYQFRPANDSHPAKVIFRTEDHTMVNDLVKRGQLTPQQALKSDKRHILSRSMMSDRNYHPEVEIDHISDIQPGDIFLLCTDGLFETLSDNDLCKMLCDPNYTDAETALELLHQCENNLDNHTAYIVRVVDVLNPTAAESSSEALPIGTVLKSQNYTYHVEKVLGQGAFGITYLVNTAVSITGQLGTIHTGVKVALKEFFMHDVMKRHGNEFTDLSEHSTAKRYAEKFRHEASKLAMLTHPNIVKVLEVFEANNTIYYSMEYLPDGSLDGYVKQTGGLPEQEAIKCIRKIGSALSYLHINKMLHLDVKPANVMRNASVDSLKLIDFGLAKRYENNGEAVTSAFLGSGTSGYAPLEQSDANAEQVFAPQIDVYALGATYYKLLTGVTPPNAITVLNNGVPTMPLVKKNVSQKSIDAIKAAMQPLIANRLKTVGEFLGMLPSLDDKTVFKPKNAKRKFTHLGYLVALLAIIVVAGGFWILHKDLQGGQYANGTETVIDSNFNMPVVKVKGGEFLMGSADKDAEVDEKPVHKVTVSDFYICKYEVTQNQWRQVMENRKPAKSKNGNCPIYDVTWDEVQQFIERLNKATGRHFRLPTEAEWEYAAKGGCKSKGYKFSGGESVDDVAWYKDNNMGYIHPVGCKHPNELGVYDMSGNVWELCSDFYSSYTRQAQINPHGPETGDYHVVRGGDWENNKHSCRVTNRQDTSLMTYYAGIGFRLVEDVNK